MLGGYQIIDLRGMSVTMGNDVSITDLNVLKQLLTLREHIEDNYNYTIPLNKRLKAVMIRLRDAKSGEKTEGCLWGNLSIIDDNLSFNIDAIVSVDPLKVLQIKVVFEKKQDDDGNDYYDIKTAKYEFRGGQDAVTVTDIKAIPSATINKLDCGDIVLKKDASGYHAYIVSFRSATGICLTYTDASCIETQSYDKVGQNWVYNSEDKSGNLIENVKPIYYHPIYCADTNNVEDADYLCRFLIAIFDNNPNAYNKTQTLAKIKQLLDGGAYINVDGCFTHNGNLIPAIMMYKIGENQYRLFGHDASSFNRTVDIDTLFALSNFQITDGVNKIN